MDSRIGEAAAALNEVQDAKVAINMMIALWTIVLIAYQRQLREM